jgi:hypothetical protein
MSLGVTGARAALFRIKKIGHFASGRDFANNPVGQRKD